MEFSLREELNRAAEVVALKSPRHIQNLSEAEETDKLAKVFFINQNLDGGYVRLNKDKELIRNENNELAIYDPSSEYEPIPAEEYLVFENDAGVASVTHNSTGIPPAWFHNVNRFVRLSKKTGISFHNLDLILRQCCDNKLDAHAIQTIAVVKKLHKTLQRDIDIVVAMLTTIPETGQGNGKQPEDLFNRVFNNPCTKVDKKYLHSPSGSVAPQFSDEEYTEISYAVNDLYAEANEAFRKRLQHALGISRLRLREITDRLERKEVDDALWMKTANRDELLHFLYRVMQLAQVLDLSHEELFTLLGLLEKDPAVARFNPQNTFIHYEPSTQNGYHILLGQNIPAEKLLTDRLWLVQSLQALSGWMKTNDYSANMLWHIATGLFRTEKEKKAAVALKIESLNALYQNFKPRALSPQLLHTEPFDSRTARLICNTAIEVEKAKCPARQTAGKKRPQSYSTDRPADCGKARPDNEGKILKAWILKKKWWINSLATWWICRISIPPASSWKKSFPKKRKTLYWKRISQTG